jgi:hypothetical protein
MRIDRTLLYRIAKRALPDILKYHLKRKFGGLSFLGQREVDDPTVQEFKKFIIEQVAGNLSGRFVLFLSGTLFDENEGQRPTRLAREMAMRNIPVGFVYWRWDDSKPSQSSRFPNIFQVPVDLFLPNTYEWFAEERIRDLQRILLIEYPHPCIVEMVNLANAQQWVTVYDVLDDWEEFCKVGQAIWYDMPVEHYLANNVDLNTVVSSGLENKMQRFGNVRTARLPNAFELGTFGNINAPVCIEKGETTIGYFGHLTSAWFNWDMVISVARRRPLWKFHVIGYGHPGNLKLPSNVLMIGKIKHDLLPNYAANWDLAMIPFKTTPLSESVDPVKIYEYVALGLRTVVTGIPGIKGCPGVILAQNEAEFESAIHELSCQAKLSAEEISRFIQSNNWGHRVDALFDLIDIYKHKSPVSRAVNV